MIINKKNSKKFRGVIYIFISVCFCLIYFSPTLKSIALTTSDDIIINAFKSEEAIH